MPAKKSISWFRKTFGAELEYAVRRTPFSVELLSAIAYQETGYIWSRMIGKLPVPEILRLCVGDTLDAPSRSAFPRNRAALLSVEEGGRMFEIAREVLVEMARHVPGYAGVARKPHKFCHGFGIFQYDLQFFEKDPQFFLQGQWQSFHLCAANLVRELYEALARQGWSGKAGLTEREQVFVAIAYNRGRAVLSKGFKQGHKSGGKFYGENIDRFLRLAKEAASGRREEVDVSNAPRAVLVGATEDIYRVHSGRIVSKGSQHRTRRAWQARAARPGMVVAPWISDRDRRGVRARHPSLRAEVPGEPGTGSAGSGERENLGGARQADARGSRQTEKGLSRLGPAEAVLRVAEQHVKERPVEIGGANRGPWVRLYCEGNDGAEWAWCAGFVSLILHQAYYYLGGRAPIDGSVSCDVLAAQAREAGLFVRGDAMDSGDLQWSDLGACAIFLRRKTVRDWTHAGFAMAAGGTRRQLVFDTIEGNTNDEGSREGFEACRRSRSLARRAYDFIALG